MKKLFMTLIVLILIFPGQWAVASEPQRGGSLVVCQPAEPPGLDPPIRQQRSTGWYGQIFMKP